jgi:hypothetical protein
LNDVTAIQMNGKASTIANGTTIAYGKIRCLT